MIDPSLIEQVSTVGLPVVVTLFCLTTLNTTIAKHTEVCNKLEAKLDLLIDALLAAQNHKAVGA